MNYQYIELSESNGICTLYLNRADKSNAMNGKMIHELTKAIHSLNHLESCRILILAGKGKHFCAGADIKWMHEVAGGSYEKNFDDAQYLADLMYILHSFSKPTIVLAHGATMGGGIGLLAAGDIALASDDAVFAFSEVKIGITPSTISPYVVNAIGERASQYYFLTAKKFNAAEAQRIGLVQQVASSENLMDEARALATDMLEAPDYALASAKQLVQHVAKKEINENLVQKTAEHLANLRTSKVAKIAINAFIQKRLVKGL